MPEIASREFARLFQAALSKGGRLSASHGAGFPLERFTWAPEVTALADVR